MGRRLRIVHPDDAWAVIRQLYLPRVPVERMGEVTLRADQAEAGQQLLRTLKEFGGALLCDEVGLGKTFTAISVARVFPSATVIAPANLLPMWKDSLARAGVNADLLSMEQFSRNDISSRRAALVVIDEAHHLRNAKTRRYKSVAEFVERSRVLLLSATPVHNSPSDLDNLLALFLGARALTPAETAACVIRRRNTSPDGPEVPRRIICKSSTPPVSDEILSEILSLPPPVPPRDGDSGALLVQLTLVRQFASSDAALKSALEKRVARAGALISALESGTYPTRRELETWTCAGAEVQLGFAGLLAAPGGNADILAAVKAHAAHVTSLLNRLRMTQSSDEWRADYLRDLRNAYAGKKIVAFTQFATTARAIYSLLRRESKVGLVSADLSAIASGPLSRHDVLSRFAPEGCRAKAPGAHEEITLLIATDLCSEGLNLQDAGVVVHLDLPWTPARLEQRVGRVARSGSQHDEIFVHSLRIPRAAEEILRMEYLLRKKLGFSDSLIGSSERASELECETSHEFTIADAHNAIASLVRSHTPSGGTINPLAQPVIAFTRGETSCFVAVLLRDEQPVLVCSTPTGPSTDPRDILRNLQQIGSDRGDHNELRSNAALETLNNWITQQDLARVLRLERSKSRDRSRTLRQIHRLARNARHSSRVRFTLASEDAWEAASLQYGQFGEGRLDDLANTISPDEKWLREIADLATERKKTRSSEGSGFRIVAVLLSGK